MVSGWPQYCRCKWLWYNLQQMFPVSLPRCPDPKARGCESVSTLQHTEVSSPFVGVGCVEFDRRPPPLMSLSASSSCTCAGRACYHELRAHKSPLALARIGPAGSISLIPETICGPDLADGASLPICVALVISAISATHRL